MTNKCEFEGCTSTETEHYDYPVWDDEPAAAWLCWEHADKSGFCPSCGYFVAGSGDDHKNGTALCGECYDELAYETGEYDDQEDDDETDYGNVVYFGLDD